jgi:hypothetical protein
MRALVTVVAVLVALRPARMALAGVRTAHLSGALGTLLAVTLAVASRIESR